MNDPAPPTLVLFANDLRLSDHPALAAAIDRGPVVPVFVWSPEEQGAFAPGGASRWWLHRSLASFARELGARGSGLVLRRGPAVEAVARLVAETGARAVFRSRSVEPADRELATRLATALSSSGAIFREFDDGSLHDPRALRTTTGGPYRVFTPFHRALLAGGVDPRPIGAPDRVPTPDRLPAAEPLDSLELEPRIDWAAGLRAAWTPGEAGARRALESFLDDGVAEYLGSRDTPGVPGVSRLSPHLHFGEISPRQVWRAVVDRLDEIPPDARRSADGYLRQIVWREFARHLLFHFPDTLEHPLHPEFEGIAWTPVGADPDDPGRRMLRAWRRGRTGYPIVDAGMRELWTTGWMHNRVRMVVASFLTKDLGIDWREGARWFHDTLVDADLANNTLGWQWTAGCGADASPWFRVFNPVLQGEKFDPRGEYVRRHVPELAGVPDRWIHRPWQAPPEVLRRAGVRIAAAEKSGDASRVGASPGATFWDEPTTGEYPAPVVDHARARDRALAAYARIRGTTGA